MKKLRSIAVGLLMGISCGAFAWIASSPRPWSEMAVWSPATGRSPQPAAHSAAPAPQPTQLTKLRSWEEFAAPRREAEVLPLAVSQVSLEAPPLEAVVPSPLEDLGLSPPMAPEFGFDEVDDESQESDGDSSEAASVWPAPTALLSQLKELTERPACRAWARATMIYVERLSAVSDLDSPQAETTLAKLAALAAQARQIASGVASLDDRSRLLAAGYALSRRVAVWRSVRAIASRFDAFMLPVAAPPQQMLTRLAAADAVLGQGRRAGDWRRYLLAGQTRLLAEAGPAADPAQRRRHAQRVLRRLEWPGLTEPQRRFLAQPEFHALGAELRAWAAEPFDFPRILKTLEEYERQPSIPLARRIADERLRLSWASHDQVTLLAAHLNEHYRNANVRAAVSQDLLQLLAPQAEITAERVTDTIAGAAVNGQSQTTSYVTFRVLTDQRRLRLLLEASGDVVTNTRSSKSGATFHTNGQAWFRVQKEIAFDGYRVTMTPAAGEARVHNDLRDVKTEYDHVPLVNLVAQSIARQGHDDARQQARLEAQQKVAWRAESRLDAEAEQRLTDLQSRVETRVGQPLEKLSLFATPIALETTSSRLIGRYRLAGDLQLGAHTARPQAPADSLLSVQIHDSAVNNTLARLPLAGREVDLPGLFQVVIDSFGAARISVPDDLPPRVKLRLDEHEPVRVDVLDGRVRVTVRLAKLETDDRTWRNVMARAYYRPETAGLSARLVRDGHIELAGDHLRLRDQVALRAIFAKVFSERRALNLIPARLAQSEKLERYEVTQLVLRDGWLGIALGPHRRTQTAQK